MLTKILGIALGFFLLGNAVRADDTFVALAAGGLVPMDPTTIQVESEEVEITPRRITIHYVFRNPGDQDESPTIAFSLPDLDGMAMCASPYHLPRKNEVNFMGFNLLSGGKPIPTQMDLQAYREGQDVTSRLAAAGITANLLQEPLNAALLKMPPEERDKLEAEGLIEAEKFAAPLEITGKRRGWCAQWTMRVRFSWTQPIGAHEAIELTQVYSPVVGGTPLMPTSDASTYGGSYCAGPELISTIAPMRVEAAQGKDKDKDVKPLLYEQAIDFVLTNANKWNGPIGVFHLTVLTLTQNDMLMTCMSGLQRTGPTRYEFQKDNFQPREELRLMILQKTRPWGW